MPDYRRRHYHHVEHHDVCVCVCEFCVCFTTLHKYVRSQHFVLTQHDYGVNYDDSDDDERLWLLYLCMFIRVCFVFWCVCVPAFSLKASLTQMYTHTNVHSNLSITITGWQAGSLGETSDTTRQLQLTHFCRNPSRGNPFCSQAGRLREAPDATSSDAAVNCDCCEIQAHHNAPMHKSNTHGSKDYRTHTHARAPTRTAQTHTHINTRAHCL